MRAWQVNGQGEPKDIMKQVTIDLAPAGPGELNVHVTASALALPIGMIPRVGLEDAELPHSTMPCKTSWTVPSPPHTKMHSEPFATASFTCLHAEPEARVAMASVW